MAIVHFGRHWHHPRMPTVNPLARSLAKLLGPGVVRDDAATLAIHATDRWFSARAPEAVVLAKTRAHVEKTLRFAHRHGIPVTPRGAGIGYVGGCVPVHGGIALSVARMNRIQEIHFADGVAVVQPGVITADLQTAARKLGLMYPPDPASMKECSLGGNIATNAGGPRCLKYGVTRHYVLGLEVVLADGRVLRCGGRTHKNKQGFDLVGAFVGSEGMLGVVTEAILRLLPLPPARATLAAGFRTFRAAADAVQRIFAAGFLPSAMEIADPFTLKSARNFLGREIAPGARSLVLVELDGQRASVKSECAALAKLLRKLGPVSVLTAFGDVECEKLWGLRRAYSDSLKATGLTKLNEDVVVPRGKLVELAEFGERLAKKHGYPVACFGHAGDGNIHVNIMAARYHDDRRVKARVDRALDELFAWVLKAGGVITGEHGIGLAKKPWWPLAVDRVGRDVHRALKSALDPKGILNPGKFI
jgi:glycolate oxidase